MLSTYIVMFNEKRYRRLGKYFNNKNNTWYIKLHGNMPYSSG